MQYAIGKKILPPDHGEVKICLYELEVAYLTIIKLQPRYSSIEGHEKRGP